MSNTINYYFDLQNIENVDILKVFKNIIDNNLNNIPYELHVLTEDEIKLLEMRGGGNDGDTTIPYVFFKQFIDYITSFTRSNEQTQESIYDRMFNSRKTVKEEDTPTETEIVPVETQPSPDETQQTQPPIMPTEIQQPIVPIQTQPPIMPTEIQPPIVPIQTQPQIVPIQTQPPIMPTEIQQPIIPVQTQPPIVPIQTQPPIMPTEIQQPIILVQTQPPIVPGQTQPPIVTTEIQPHIVPSQTQQTGIYGEPKIFGGNDNITNVLKIKLTFKKEFLFQLLFLKKLRYSN
jgi:hypothetical protein